MTWCLFFTRNLEKSACWSCQIVVELETLCLTNLLIKQHIQLLWFTGSVTTSLEGASADGALTSGLPASERERLIQCGEMTPFGTALSSVVSQPVHPSRSSESGATMREEREAGSAEVRVESHPDILSKRKVPKRTSEKLFHRIQHVEEDGDGDYVPNTTEYHESFCSSTSEGNESDYEPDAKRRRTLAEKGSTRNKYEPRELSDDEDDNTPRRRLRRSTVGASCQDDGDEKLYRERMRY